MAKMNAIKEKNWAMGCHLIAFAGFVIPFGNVIGPLVIWLIKKDESAFIDDQGKESLNFQISITIYFIASIFLSLFLIGIPLLLAVGVFFIVMVIIAGVKASNGEKYRYPLCIRLVQ